MTAADRLNRLVARHRGLLTARMIDDPMVRALLWKRRRWAADAIMEGCGYGRLPEWNTAEFLDAEQDYHEAGRLHREIIQSLWGIRCMSRGYAPVRELEAAE